MTPGYLSTIIVMLLFVLIALALRQTSVKKLHLLTPNDAAYAGYTVIKWVTTLALVIFALWAAVEVADKLGWGFRPTENVQESSPSVDERVQPVTPHDDIETVKPADELKKTQTKNTDRLREFEGLLLDMRKEAVRNRALDKLTDEERRALGVQ
jgi:hypothetical protein